MYTTNAIDKQIEELQKLKNSYAQQPINIFNNNNTSQNDFKAQYLNENEKVDEIFVQCKTAFIDLKNGVLSIKETNGDITTYEIILPKDEKDLKIEELERKLKEYEQSSTTNIK